VSLLRNLNLQNARELKHYSFFTLPNTCTMAILANLKYLGNAQACTLDVERMHQSHLKGFISNDLAMATQTFDFMVSLKMDC